MMTKKYITKSPMNISDLSTMFEKLTGRKPTAAESKEAERILIGSAPPKASEKQARR